ncbi:MAG: hypothetical protein KIH08_13950, partial [Candidatus Freyarchaeota archaeon]|nr:hypothetical protein [Candidatus Jordarchaeia archaeon]
ASVLITSLILRSSSRMPVHPPLLLYSPTFKLFFNKFKDDARFKFPKNSMCATKIVENGKAKKKQDN